MQPNDRRYKTVLKRTQSKEKEIKEDLTKEEIKKLTL